MIVVGILLIVIGLFVAVWASIQSGSDLYANAEKYGATIKQYVFNPLDEKIAANTDPDLASKYTTLKNVYASHELDVSPIKESLVNGFVTFGIIMIAIGVACLVLFVLFDAKRKKANLADAKVIFKENKVSFIVSAVGTVVAAVATIWAWIQTSTFKYALQSEVELWNEYVDSLVYMGNAEESWTSWMKFEPAKVLAEFGAGSTVNIKMLGIVSTVSLIALVIFAVVLMSNIGKLGKTKLFPVFNSIIFVIFALIIMIPIYKVLIDSIDGAANPTLTLLPKKFTLQAYKDIITRTSLRTPFLISVITTLAGTFLGLTLSTLGAYVLIQFEMPGRNLFAYLLLFTMIFQGGMIPTFLAIKSLGLLNSLGSVILPLSINVYNLVLMRNFFEGIPGSLFEAAEIDGCSPMAIFIKIVLPLSKAAIASIGLMFSVLFWNDYTNFKLYISNPKLFNFQLKLRSMFDEGSITESVYYGETTAQSSAVIVAILPFMIIYPFCQKYFVQGVNVGAVKE